MFLLLGSGVDMFKGPGDLYYPSNALDPYLKNKDVSFVASTLFFIFFLFLCSFAFVVEES